MEFGRRAGPDKMPAGAAVRPGHQVIVWALPGGGCAWWVADGATPQPNPKEVKGQGKTCRWNAEVIAEVALKIGRVVTAVPAEEPVRRFHPEVLRQRDLTLPGVQKARQDAPTKSAADVAFMGVPPPRALRALARRDSRSFCP